MFIAVDRLLIRLRRGPASRVDELVELGRRVRAEAASDVDDEERRLAGEVHARKLDVVAQFGEVRACSSCAIRQPWPIGGYAGGACCSGVTEELFDDNELAALVHAGTRTRDLVPPPRRDAHAGCSFRGPRGCTLDAAHRPARCVHYVCDVLRRELHHRGELDALEAALAALNDAMQRFTAAHQARRDREVLAPIVDAIRDSLRAT